MATNFTDKSISSIQLKDEKYHIKSIPFHATEEEWNSTLASYVPKQAEIVVYDADENFDLQRIKIGDGTTPVGKLKFAGGAQADWNAAEGEPGHVLNRTHWVDADGTVHKMDKMFLPDCIDGGALFGMSEKQVEVLPETNVRFYHNGVEYARKASFENMQNDVEFPFPELSYGKYIVYWRGVPYECAVQCANGSNPDGSVWKRTILGNVAGVKNTEFAGINMGIDSGEPFLIDAFFIYVPGATASYITFYRFDDADTEEFVPVQIFLCETVINKMPTKYLPDGVPYVVAGVRAEVQPETTVEVNDMGEMDCEVQTLLVVGETYTVNWNGTEYTCVAQDASAFASGAVGLGELTELGLLGNGEPFALLIGEDEGAKSAFIAPFDGSTSVTFSIYQDGTEIHKLDNRCLPDGVPYIGEKLEKVLDEITANFDGGKYLYRGSSPLNIAVGQNYLVKWNGKEYRCMAVDGTGLSGVEQGSVVLANPGANLTTYAGMIFAIVTVPGETMATIVSNDSEATVSIHHITPEYHKLDEGLLPESVDGIVVRSSTADSTKKFKITVDDSGTITATEV